MACSNNLPESALQDVLECKICRSPINKPQILQQCLHSFCKTCLDIVPMKDRNGHTGIFCPECDDFTKEDQVLENNFLNDLKNLIVKGAEDSSKAFCKQCPKKEVNATWKCCQCKIEICDECKHVHLNIPMLKDHQIIQLEHETAYKAIDNLLFCKLHNYKVIEFNCKICEIPICSMCISLLHNGHTIETVPEALKRIRPNTAGYATNIQSYTEQIKAQIEATNVKMDQTKEIYSSCRMKMDERLQKVINNLKAMKAKMEDEVTEQETIALNIIEKVKHGLECKLRKACHLVKLVDVTFDKAQHASLLNVLQAGLYRKTKQSSEEKPKSVEFQTKIPQFDEEPYLHGKLTEIHELIGELSYSVSKDSLDTVGVLWAQNRFMCSDFTPVFGKKLSKLKTISFGESWCNRISYIDGYIVVPFLSEEDGDGIRIYDKLGNCVRKIGNTLNDRDINVIRKVNNGDVIAGGTKGLYLTNSSFSEWIKLCGGCYSDIAIQEKNIIALEYETYRVITLALATSKDNADKKWEKISEFPVAYYFQKCPIGCNSTLLIENEKVIIADQSYVYIFKNGRFVNKYYANWVPKLCGWDETGKCLMGNFQDGKLYAVPDSEDHTLKNVKNQSAAMSLNCPGIRDAVFVDDNCIWILQENTLDKNYNLIQYGTM